MAFPATKNHFDDERSDEGVIYTIPTTKIRKYNKCKKKKYRDHNDDVRVKEFIQKYKLESIARQILNERLTFDFLIAQNDADVDAISKELTSKPIQQKKFQFAVKELQKAHKKPTKPIPKPVPPVALAAPKHNVEAIDMKVEKKSKTFGNNKTITAWYYNGSDGLKHEVILKHHTKTTKNLTSKRTIVVDGKERYAKKSNSLNFVIKECSDDIRIEIVHDKKVFYELYINNIAFTDLMNPQVPSFSL
eukprot:377343_1